MSGNCPLCGLELVQTTHSGSSAAAAPWYRRVAPEYYCPRCGIRLRTRVRPAGYVALALLLIASGVDVLCWLLPPPVAGRAWRAPLGVTLLVLALAMCYVLRGRRFSTLKVLDQEKL